MARDTTRIDAHSIWYREWGATEDYDQLRQEEVGMDEVPLQERAQTTVFGKNNRGEFVEVVTSTDPPGALPSFGINFYERWSEIYPLLKLHNKNARVFIQRLRFQNPNNVDIRTSAKQADTFDVTFSGGSRGAGPNIDGTGGALQSNVTVNVKKNTTTQLDLSLSRLTTTEAQDILSIDGIWERFPDRDNGEPEPDKVLYFGANTSGSAPGNLLVSTNGGSTISAVTTDPTPSAGNRGIAVILHKPVSETQFRLVTLNGTLTGAKPAFSYDDVEYGSEDTIAAFTEITIAGGSNADAFTAGVWTDFSRLYMATDAGDIFLSTDGAETDPGTAISAGGNAINHMIEDYEGNVWAVGASNTILFEDRTSQGTFVSKTGPSGGGAFYSIARAEDGTIFAGNGQKIFKNTNKALNTGGWTELKDFGSNHLVKRVHCVEGTSEVLYAVVDDTTPADTEIFRSINGGLTWTPITQLANDGYNDAKFSEVDPNLGFIVGDAESSTGVIQKLS